VIVNSEFLNNGAFDRDRALNFFKVNAVTTGSGLGLAGQQPVIGDEVHAVCDRFSGVGSEKPIRSGSFNATLIQFNLDRDEKCEVQFVRAGGGDQNTIGAYYLPWGGMFVMSMKLPPAPATDFFFTAGLVGCSVFASGNPAQPTVYHAGTEGAYRGDVAKFWRRCIRAVARSKGQRVSTLAGIDKGHYLSNPQAQAFENWVKQKVMSKLRVERTANGGFVFGIRHNGDWEFYLQDRVLVETLEFVKKPKSGMSISQPLSPQQVSLTTGSTSVRPVMGTVTKGRIFKTTEEVEIGCKIIRVVSHPVTLRRFFPAGSFTVNLVDKWDLNV